MEIMKRIGAGILGAAEGVLIAIIVMFVIFSVNKTEGEDFSISVGWCILGGVLGAFVCACYPPASLVIFVGLVILLKTMGTRDRRR